MTQQLHKPVGIIGANILYPMTNYYWAHQIYIILSIFGPT